MENYRRDDFWDAATWAELHQAVLDEVDRVRVARKVFYTEDLSGAPCGAPSWRRPPKLIPRQATCEFLKTTQSRSSRSLLNFI